MTPKPDPALIAPLPAALQALLADDEACLRMAEAYDREDAAQRGEADPHGLDRAPRMGDYADWAADRIACAKEAIRAAIADTEGR